MPDTYASILAEIVAVARDAGALTLEHFRRFRDIDIGIKGPADFVSDADKESEQLIRRAFFALLSCRENMKEHTYAVWWELWRFEARSLRVIFLPVLSLK